MKGEGEGGTRATKREPRGGAWDGHWHGMGWDEIGVCDKGKPGPQRET